MRRAASELVSSGEQVEIRVRGRSVGDCQFRKLGTELEGGGGESPVRGGGAGRRQEAPAGGAKSGDGFCVGEHCEEREML